jgi:hypothetical protein
MVHKPAVVQRTTLTAFCRATGYPLLPDYQPNGSQGLTKSSTYYKIGILYTIDTLKIGILYRKYIPLCGILFALKFLDEVTTLVKKGG